MHNVMLTESPGFKMRVRWLRAMISPTKPSVVPSFDEPTSFALNIESGVVGSNVADLSKALNSGVLKNSPVSNVSISPQGNQLKVNATIHKGVPLPIELISDIGASSDGRIRMHISKIRALKIPVKGLLKAFNVQASDLVDPKGARGVEVSGDDIFFDPEQILPAPRKRGKLTNVHLKNSEIVQVYGAARPEVQKRQEWRNYVAMRGGQLKFGKLTMEHVDIVMIDISKGDYFNFDLEHYQEQLVNGYTRMTPEAGLRIFMPDLNSIPKTKNNQAIGLQWMKNRNAAPPEDLVP